MRILLIYQYFLADNESGHTRWNEMVKLWAGDNHEITVLTGMVNYSTGLKQDKYKGKYFAKEKQGYLIEIVSCYVSEAYNKNFSG